MSESPTPPGQDDAGDSVRTTLHRSFGAVAALVMLLLVLVTFADVLARYIFSAPIPGAYEITELLMGVLVFTALPVITWGKQHITIDILDSVTPARLAVFRDLLVTAVSGVVLGVMAWRMGLLAERLGDYGDVTEYLRIPLSPVIYLLGALSAVSCLLLLAVLGRDLRRLFVLAAKARRTIR